MRNSIEPCVYLYIITYLVTFTEGITYLKGISTPKWTTRMIPLSKWLDDNNWRLAPYGNHEFTKIFRQYKHVIHNKYYEEAPANWTDSSLGKYVQSLFFTSTPGPTKKLLKKDKIKLGKLKLIKEKMQKLEDRLGFTFETTPTTSEPTTAPYTGISTRFTLTSFFDPDYIFDPNFILREVKRLKRDASNLHFSQIRSPVSKTKKSKRDTSKLNYIHDEDQVNSCHSEHRKHQNLLRKFLLREETDEKCKIWMNVERLQHGFKGFNIERHKSIEVKSKKQMLFKRNVFGPELSKKIILDKITFPPETRVLVKRDLGKIIRRSTRRPHLSRRFKAYSMKRYREDQRVAQMITNWQANMTIIPEFLEMSHVLHDLEKNKLSTLVYVYNGVGYFGSVPPDLLTTERTVPSTKVKTVTYELGATKVLEKHIFDDEKKRSPKLSPADADIECLNTLERHIDSLEPKKERAEVVSETDNRKTKKSGRTWEKEKTKRNDNSTDTLKKTRTSERSIQDSSDDSLHQLADTNEVRKRKSRSVSLNRANHQYPPSLLVLPAILCLLQKEMHFRGKRNVQEKVEPNELKLEDTSKLGHIGRFKESIKRSKNKFVSYVREKKESLIAIPRRARYVVREMFLDGKFFYQELKEVPSRVKKDFEEKKDLLKLVWDMMKIFMPVTEKGEKGGTTPEPKIVEDPKQYVKNIDNYVTPDLSELHSTPTTHTCTESEHERTLLHEIKSAETLRTIEKKTSTPINSKKHEIVQTRTSVAERTTIGPETKKSSISGGIAKTKPYTTLNLFTNNDYLKKKSTEYTSKVSSESINHNQPALITNEPITLRTYLTRVIGPDFISKNTERGDRKDQEKTKKTDKLDLVMEKLNDDKTFDHLSASMKNKDFMDKVLDNADTDRLKNIMGIIKPQDVLSKLDQKTIQKMSKLMTEIDTGTMSKMQNIARKTMNFGKPGHDVVRTR